MIDFSGFLYIVSRYKKEANVMEVVLEACSVFDPHDTG
jgi:hypothetical protein